MLNKKTPSPAEYCPTIQIGNTNRNTDHNLGEWTAIYNQRITMSYQVLARKYRPQKFSDVIGQDHVTRTLKNAIEQQRIAHGYIFSGHRGIGKTTIARILAMALNCRTAIGSTIGTESRPTPEPCGV